MTIIQVLTINWSHVFNAAILIISFSGFVISYKKYVSRTVDKEDLDKLERKMDNEVEKMSKRIDKVEEQIRIDIREIKEMQRDIYGYLLNHHDK